MTNHAPLDARIHRDLRVQASLADEVMACLTVPSEFRRIQNEFPILFRRNVDSGELSALALFGFENGENLFVEQGRWTARYRPLAIAIQPFLVGRPETAGGAASVHVDLDHPRIASSEEEGLRAFSDDGQPTPYLEAVMAGLDELDQGHRASPAFFADLQRYDLLEPFSLDVELNDGSNHRMVGYHMIDEEKLRSLEAGALAELQAAGHLLPTFMAIASLSNLAVLVDRKNARGPRG